MHATDLAAQLQHIQGPCCPVQPYALRLHAYTLCAEPGRTTSEGSGWPRCTGMRSTRPSASASTMHEPPTARTSVCTCTHTHMQAMQGLAKLMSQRVCACERACLYPGLHAGLRACGREGSKYNKLKYSVGSVHIQVQHLQNQGMPPWVALGSGGCRCTYVHAYITSVQVPK